MEKDYVISDDMSDLIKDFIHWKEAYLEIQKSYREMHGKVEILHEELRIAKDHDRSERYKDSSMHNLLNQQQLIIDELLGLKDENIKLTSHNQELGNACKDLQKKLDLMVKEHEEEVENLKALQSVERENILKKSGDEVMAVKRELEKNQEEFHQRYKEIASKLDALKQERDEQVNLLIAEYEGKLQKSNELLASATIENKNLRERATANMSIYQKKLLELEKENAIASFQSYESNPSTAQIMDRNFSKRKEYRRPMASTSKFAQNSTDTSIHLPQVHSRQQQGIKKYLNGSQNPLRMIADPQDSLGLVDNYSEDEKESMSHSRTNVAFPIIKKKKLFTPGDNNLLKP